MLQPFNIPIMDETAFNLHTTADVSFYSCRALEKIPGLRHGFSTRQRGEHSQLEQPLNLGYTAWDSDDRVDENKRLFLSALNLCNTRLATLHQIHSCRIHIIKELPDKWNPPQGDALVAGIQSMALAVQTADCLPVLIADPNGSVIAAVHSGWRGTLQQIAFHTIYAMRNAFGSNPADLQVAIGPGIRSCCFEVGQEVYDLFLINSRETLKAKPSSGRQGKYLLDLPEILKIQLHSAGINPDNIYDLALCTCCSTDTFFSYRAEGVNAGRLMSVIGMET